MITSDNPATGNARQSGPKSTSEFALRLLGATRRHWMAAMFCFGILMFGLVTFLIIVPRQYISSGKLFVRHGRGGVTLDPTATTSKNVHIQETRDAEINTVADVLGSRALLEQVVDHFTPKTILESHFFLSDYIQLPEISLPSFSTADATDSLDGVESSYDDLMERELAILKLDGNVDVKASKKAATVNITVKAGTPKLAQEMVSFMMDRYLDMHIAARKTDGSQNFFEEQLKLQRKSMVEAQHTIRDYKNAIGIMSVEGERSSLQMQLDRVEHGLIQADSDAAAARERVATLANQLVQLDPSVVATRVEGNANEGADMMRNSLFTLEAQREELSSRYYPTHPDVQALTAAIEQARKYVDQHPYDREEVTTAMNPTRMEIEKAMLLARAEVESTAARRQALVGKQAMLESRLDDLNDCEARLRLMERDLEIASNNHKEYAEKLEEARINAALDRDRISNVKIVQPASLVVKAVSPRRSIIFVFGTAFMTCVSLALAYFLDSIDTTLRTSDDLAEHIDVPVLVSLPRAVAKQPISGG